MRKKLFRFRSYTPIPFIIVMLVFARPSTRSVVTGMTMAVTGEAIRFWGVAYAGSLTRVTGGVGAPEVIVAGPFSFVRNPLYVGNVLMYVGFGVASYALWPWLPALALLFFLFQYRAIVSLEEEFLEKEFGAAYLEYRKNVPRFIPRPVPYRSPAQEGQTPRWNEALRSEKRTLQAFLTVSALLLVLWQWGR
ncbi:MAG TPA: methyltransferase [Bacteroidota bacterium]|nr:methyltransferase [Bacteroidota bacterium]